MTTAHTATTAKAIAYELEAVKQEIALNIFCDMPELNVELYKKAERLSRELGHLKNAEASKHRQAFATSFYPEARASLAKAGAA